MLNGSGDGKHLRKVITDTLPFLPDSVVDTVMNALRKELGHASMATVLSTSNDASFLDKTERTGHLADSLQSQVDVPTHRLHSYINATMRLEETLIERMNTLTPTEFERILHPVFEEDEMTLIVAGGILGFTAGAMQWWFKVLYENNLTLKENQTGKVIPITQTGLGRYESAKSTVPPSTLSRRLNNNHRRLFSTVVHENVCHQPHWHTKVWRFFRRVKYVL
mmetsp:Transcript_24961/g.42220  ORF Transcript_24961/g.42220 Transcript_24961/m.42220 type:complete len:222 (+) Transcript_24961:112-777(+)